MPLFDAQVPEEEPALRPETFRVERLELRLHREPTHGEATFGQLLHWNTPTGEPLFLCHTLEDALREVPGRPVEEWKVPGATAIPAGQYRVVLETSARFGPLTPTLLAVPGFQYIRIHAGNVVEDTSGCVLVGLTRSPPGGKGRPWLGQSRVALGQLKAMLGNWLGTPALPRPEGEPHREVWLTLLNP